jgi:membrane fusion protein (multidrug efflux system)
MTGHAAIMISPIDISKISRPRLVMSLSVALIAAVSLPLLSPEGAAQVAGGPPPPSVVVETVQYTDLKGKTTFSGRIEAVDKIELRTRVPGLITKREFREGAEVKKGQLLFEIDRRPYEIALEQAQANLASSQSAMDSAGDTYTRTEELVTRQVSSSATLSSSKSQLAQAKAKVAFDQAQVEQAKLNLNYTQIRAEISGRVGRVAHAVGDYVNEASTPLATLISQDTVYVTFSVPRPALADLAKSKDGTFKADVELRFGDGEVYGHTGRIAFIDIEANAATNTVVVRAEVPNPDRALLPQELVDVTIIDAQATKTLVVSQSALLLDQLGSYVLSVDDKNKVEIRRFETGIYRGSYVTVKSGLSEGERVIVSGHLKAQPGMIVAPQSTPIEVSNSSGNPTP